MTTGELGLRDRLKHLLDVGLPANEFHLHVEETRAGSAFVREPNGDGIAPLVYPIGLLPIDLIQELIVDPRSGVVGELSLDKVTKQRFGVFVT